MHALFFMRTMRHSMLCMSEKTIFDGFSGTESVYRTVICTIKSKKPSALFCSALEAASSKSASLFAAATLETIYPLSNKVSSTPFSISTVAARSDSVPPSFWHIKTLTEDANEKDDAVNKKIMQIKKRVPALTLFPLFYCRFFLSRD